MVNLLNNLKVDTSALVVLAAPDRNVGLSARNIPGVKTALVNTINTFDILKYKKFIITRDAVAKVEEVYAG
jgi:large subunit ribosomal protein L4